MKKTLLSIISIFLSIVLITPNVSVFGLSSSLETKQSGITALAESGALDIEQVENTPTLAEVTETQASSEVIITESSEPTTNLPADESIVTKTSEEEAEPTSTTEPAISEGSESLSSSSTEVSEETFPEEQPHPDDALVSQYAYLDLKVPGRQARSATTIRPYDILADVASKSEIKDSKILQVGNAIIYDASLVKTYFPLAESITFEKVENNYFVTYTTASEDLIVLGYYDTGAIHKSVDLKSESNLIYIDENGGMVYPDSYFKSEPLSPELNAKVYQAVMNNDITTLNSIPEIAVYEVDNTLIIDSTVSQAESAYMSNVKSNRESVENELLNSGDPALLPYTDKFLGYHTDKVNGKHILLTAFESRDNYRFYINNTQNVEPNTPLEIAIGTAVTAGLIIAGASGSSVIAAILFFQEIFSAVVELNENYGYLLKDPIQIVTRSTCFYDFERPIYYNISVADYLVWPYKGSMNFQLNPNAKTVYNFVYTMDDEVKVKVPIFAQRFENGEYKMVEVDAIQVFENKWSRQPGNPMETASWFIYLSSFFNLAAGLSDYDLTNYYPFPSDFVNQTISNYLIQNGVSIDLRDSDVGDTPWEATSIEPNLLYLSNSDHSSDSDYYKFIVPESVGNLMTNYEFTVESTDPNYSLECQLLKPMPNGIFDPISSTYTYNHQIAADGINKNIRIFWEPLEPGTYFIKIKYSSARSRGSNPKSFSYQLKMSAISVDLVPDDYLGYNHGSTTLLSNKTFEEAINYSYDKDYYKLNVPENPGNLLTNYEFTVESFDPKYSLECQLSKLMPDGSLDTISSNHTYNHIAKDGLVKEFKTFWAALEPGTYFIKIYYSSARSIGSNPKSFSYQLQLAASSTDIVPNDHLGLNPILISDETFEEYINYSSDKDYYKFVVPENAGNLKTNYEFFVESADPNFGLYCRIEKIEANGGLSNVTNDYTRFSLIDNNENNSRIFFRALEPGTYFIKINYDSLHSKLDYSKPYSYRVKANAISVDKVCDDYKSTDRLFGPVSIPQISTQQLYFSESFNYSGDTDCYKFTSSGTSSTSNLVTFGDSDPYGTIYKVEYDLFGNPSSYKAVRSVDGGGVGKNIKMTINLPEGNYVLALKNRVSAPVDYGIAIDGAGILN